MFYSFTKRGSNKEEQIIYMWQGATTSLDEKGTCALLAVDLDNQYGGKPTQVRVVQGKEPAHFRKLFEGKLVIHTGGVESGFHRRGSGASSVGDESLSASTPLAPALFHIKGSSAANTYAVQVPTTAMSLNSGDCFLLLLPQDGVLYAWLGEGSNAPEREAATVLAEVLKTEGDMEVTVVEEGCEPDEFWTSLGGLATYPRLKPGWETVPREPRLFQLSNATGAMKVEEVVNYAQVDLEDNDVFLLDTYNTVFVWVGTHANAVEKAQALKVAQAYIDKAADGRDPTTPIIKVTAGHEPSLFTQHFLGWDATLAEQNTFVDPYEAKLAKLKEEKAQKQALVEAAEAAAAEKKEEEQVVVEKKKEEVKEKPTPPPAVTAVVSPPPSPKTSSNGAAAPSPPAKETTTPVKATPSPRPAAAEKKVSTPAPEASSKPSKAAPTTPASSSSSSANATTIPSPQEAAGDPTKREATLSDAEFATTFSMSKPEFYALPRWKQVALKKAAGLF